ncbi:kinase-like domain-containing protein, partial [Gorgonomyces haynaldii]
LILERYTCDMREYVKRRKINKRYIVDVIPLVKQMVECVKQLQRDKLIHFDIKLDNFFYKDGVIVLGDFGLCMDEKEYNLMTNHGEKHSFRGTCTTMAPEVLFEFPSDNRFKIDLYSLGVVLYQILTHRLPFYET